MPKIEDCKTWLNKVKPMLGFGDRRKMGKRNQEVADLLRSMRTIVEDEKSKPKLTKSRDGYEAFEKSFDELKSEFEKLANDAKNATGKDEAEKIAAKVRKLKQKVRLELGSVKPNESPKVKQQLLAAARHRPIYEDRVKEFEGLVERLKTMPGTAEQRKVLRARLKLAKTRLPDYKEAVKELTFFQDLNVQQGEGLRQIIKEAQTSANDLPGKLFDDEFRVAFEDAESKWKEYSEIASLADAGTVEKFRADIQKVLKDGEKKEDADAAKKTIKRLGSKLDTLIKQSKKDRKGLVDAKKEATDKWHGVEETAPLHQVAELKAIKERAESLESSQLYSAAADAYSELSGEIDTVLSKCSTAPDDWKNLEPEIAEMEETLDAALELSELGSMAGSLKSVILSARNDVKLHQDFVSACEAIENIRGEFKTLKKAVASLRDPNNDPKKVPDARFPDPSLTVEVKLNGLTKMVGQLVGNVTKKEIEALKNAGGDVSKYVAECDAVMKDTAQFVAERPVTFDRRYLRETEKKKKKEVLDKTLSRIDDEYAAMMKRVEEIAEEASEILSDSSGKFEASQESATKKKAEKEAREMLRAAQEQIDKLAELHMPKLPSEIVEVGKRIGRRIKEIDQGTVDTEKLKSVEEQVAKALKAIEDKIAERRKNAQERAKALNQRIDKFEKDAPKYQEYFQTMRTTVAVAEGKLSSRTWPVSEKGELELAGVETEIDNLKDKLKDSTQNYAMVENKVKELKKELEELKKRDPRGHAVVEHLFTNNVLPESRKLLPDEALKKLEEFETGKLAKAKTAADTLETNKENFAKEAKKLKKEMKAFARSAPALYRSLIARLDSAESSVSGNYDVAQNELDAISLIIETAAGDENKAAKLNNNAAEEEFEDERRKEEYLAQKDLFETNFKNQAREIASGGMGAPKSGREDEYKAMNKFVEGADRMAKLKPPDFAGARNNLEKAIEMARFIIENPSDDTTPIGRNLKKVQTTWKTRVATYLKEVSELTNMIVGATPPDVNDDPIDGDGVRKTLKPLLSLFDPKALDPYVEELSKSTKGADLNQRRKMKEQALLRVRRFQKQLDANQLLKYVAFNPIADISLKPLRDSLRGFEAELLGS